MIIIRHSLVGITMRLQRQAHYEKLSETVIVWTGLEMGIYVLRSHFGSEYFSFREGFSGQVWIVLILTSAVSSSS